MLEPRNRNKFFESLKNDPGSFGDQVTMLTLELQLAANVETFVEELVKLCEESEHWETNKLLLMPIMLLEIDARVDYLEATKLVETEAKLTLETFFKLQTEKILKNFSHLESSTIAMIILDSLSEIAEDARHYSGALDSPYVDIVESIRENLPTTPEFISPETFKLDSNLPPANDQEG